MNSHMNFIKEQLYTLTSIPSPSSFTAKVTDYLLSELSSLGYSPERSNKGNVFVTWVVPALLWYWQPMLIHWGLWFAPSRKTDVCGPQPSEGISGPRRTARTAPFTPVTAEFTPV